MANNKALKFFKVATLPKSSLTVGGIYFDDNTHTLHVATSQTETIQYSGVKSASYANNKLTILNEKDDTLTLDFSNVASKTDVNNVIVEALGDTYVSATAVADSNGKVRKVKVAATKKLTDAITAANAAVTTAQLDGAITSAETNVSENKLSITTSIASNAVKNDHIEAVDASKIKTGTIVADRLPDIPNTKLTGIANWAKNSTKPTYTAKEIKTVEAIGSSDEPTVPASSTIQVALTNILNVANQGVSDAGGKVASVSGDKKAIVSSGGTNPIISLKTNNTGNVKFTEDASGLSANVTIPGHQAAAKTVTLTGAVTGTATAQSAGATLSIATTLSDLDASKITTGTLDAARIPSLDASKITTGTISIERIPAAAVETVKVVKDKAARLALKPGEVQKGDTVKEQDTKKMYFVIDDTKLSQETSYEEYIVGSAAKADEATKLSTARTLTVGKTGKTFDGQGDVSWSLNEIGAASSEHTVKVASKTELGHIKIGYEENGKKYPVELDNNNKAFVNVPWTEGHDSQFKLSGTNATLTLSKDNVAQDIVTVDNVANATNAGTANKVAKKATLTIKGGAVEDTSKYTFDGSVAKTLDIAQGTNITLTAAANKLTISAKDSATTIAASGDEYVTLTHNGKSGFTDQKITAATNVATAMDSGLTVGSHKLADAYITKTYIDNTVSNAMTWVEFAE